MKRHKNFQPEWVSELPTFEKVILPNYLFSVLNAFRQGDGLSYNYNLPKLPNHIISIYWIVVVIHGPTEYNPNNYAEIAEIAETQRL